MPLVGSSGTAEVSTAQGEWAVSHNPLYNQGSSVAAGTPGTASQGAVSVARTAVGGGYPTPQRLDFAVGECETPGGVQQPSPVSTPGAGSAMHSSMASAQQAAAAVASQMSALGLGAAGISFGSAHASTAEVLWGGEQGLLYITHKNKRTVEVSRLAQKGGDAMACVQLIGSKIAPMTPGAEAHDLVVLAMQPLFEDVLNGLPIPAVALVIPALEYLITGEVLSEISPAEDGHTLVQLALAMRASQVFDGEHKDDAAKYAALLRLGTAQELLQVVDIVPGSEPLKRFILAQSNPAASSSTQQQRRAAALGWTQVGTKWKHNVHPGFYSLNDMVVLVYWLTFSRYFEVIGTRQVQQVRTMTMVAGEQPIAFATRLHALAEAVRAAHAQNPSSSDITPAEEYEVFKRAVESSSEYSGVFAALRGKILTLAAAHRTALHVARLVEQGWQVEQDAAMERARLLAAAGGEQQAPAQQQARQAGTAGVTIQHAGQRHVDSCVAQMHPRLQQNLLRALAKSQGVGSLQSLVEPEVVAAAGAVGGHAGLSQHRAMQGRQQAGGARRPCKCVRPRHRDYADCWVSNPALAPEWWEPPPPNSANYAAYVEACKLDGVPVGGGGSGVRVTFPAALCVEVGEVSGVMSDVGQQCDAGPSQVAAVPVVAAAATRAGIDREVGAAGRVPVQLELEVQLTLGRDKDIVLTLLERAQQGGVDSAVLEAAVAASLFSFGTVDSTLHTPELLGDWAKGTVTAKTTLLYPRDEDVLRQLLARNALVRCSVQVAGGEVPVAAAAAEAALGSLLASMSPELRKQFLKWRDGEGGLVFFANRSRQEGAALVTSDGRYFLPHRFMLDTGCQQGLLDEDYGKSMGLTAVQVAPKQLRTATGDVFAVSKQFRGLRVVLAAGTAHEASCELDFWCMPGLVALAQAIFPVKADHAFAAVGVDRVFEVYRYRPLFAESGQDVWASIPVVTQLQQGAPVEALVAAPVVGVDGEDNAAAGSRLPVTGTWCSDRQVLSGLECELLLAGNYGVLMVEPPVPLRPQGDAAWASLQGCRRLQWAQFYYGAQEMEDDGDWGDLWGSLGTSMGQWPDSGHDMFTQQPQFTAADFRVDTGDWVAVLHSPLFDKLKQMDGFTHSLGLWERVEVTLVQLNRAPDAREPFEWGPRPRGSLGRFLHQWMRAWQSTDEDLEQQTAYEYGDMGRVNFDPPGFESLWVERWLLLFSLWEVLGAPAPTAGKVIQDMALGLSMRNNLPVHVQRLVEMAEAGLHLLQVAAQFKSVVAGVHSLELVQQSAEVLKAVGTLRVALRWGVTQWVGRHEDQEEQAGVLQMMDQLNLAATEATPGQGEPQPAARVVAHRPRYSRLRLWLVSIIAFLLVCDVLQLAGAVPVWQPVGGTFRACWP